MTKQQQTADIVDNLTATGRDALRRVNRRHVVIRQQDGTKIADLGLSIVILIAIALFVLQPVGTILIVGAVAYGLITKVRIEMIRELTADDQVIDLTLPHDD